MATDDDRRDPLRNVSIGLVGEGTAAVAAALTRVATEKGWHHINVGSPIEAAEVAILVVSAVNGLSPNHRAELLTVRKVNVPHLVVALTEVDKLADPELLNLVELEVRQLAKDCGFSSELPVVYLSVSQKLQESTRAQAGVARLIESLEGYLAGHR